jgi:hypothetical protein
MPILCGEHQRARARPRLVLLGLAGLHIDLDLGLEGLHIDLDGPLALQERHERPLVPILCCKHERSEAAHAQRLKDLATSAQQQADALQERLIAALQKVAPDETRWELPEHKITSRKTTAVDVTADALELPGQYQRIKTTITADKTALAAALKGGAQIEGCALVERRSWSIK